VTKILPALKTLLVPNGRVIVLIKPQFEVGRGEVGKGGIVRDTEKHERVVSEINTFAKRVGLHAIGVIDSPILGAEGNKEFLALYMHDEPNPVTEEPKTFDEGIDFYFEDGLMVLTRRYLLNRGFCCENRCRHCPYGNAPEPELK
jgi:hypothetical protein